MRKLPDIEKKQSPQRKQKSLGKKKQQQTRASNSLGWNVANDLLAWLWLELEARGITNEKLSKATGIRVGTIESWQKTARLPSLESMASCVGFLGYELIPMRGIVHVKEDVYFHPIAQFRQKLLEDKLVSEARAEEKTLDQYVNEKSSEVEKTALYSKIAKQDEALGELEEQLDDEGAFHRRQVEAAKVDPSVRVPFRWNA